MRDLANLVVHLSVMLARLAKPGGLRSVAAESALVRRTCGLVDFAVLFPLGRVSEAPRYATLRRPGKESAQLAGASQPIYIDSKVQWRRILMTLDRITRDPSIMGGKPCLRGMRVTVGTVVGLVAARHTDAEILEAYPYLEVEDVRQALAYAAWRVEEIEIPLPAA